MKLYDLYEVISNKTVRKHEKFYKRYKGHRAVPGMLVRTNRGFFIDGYQVDVKSVDLWFNLVKANRNGKS